MENGFKTIRELVKQEKKFSNCANTIGKKQCIGRTERKSSVQFKSSFFGEL